MPDLGQLLRDTMTRYQEEAPAADGLLSGARRRRRQRTILAAGPVVVAVAAIVAGAVILTHNSSAPGTADHAALIPSLTGQGTLDDQLFEVQAPMLSPVFGGLGPQPHDPCATTDVNARGELRRTFDGVVGVVVLSTTKDCSVFVDGTPMLVDAVGRALQVPYDNPDPTTAEFTKSGLHADFNGGEGRIGFAWRGSWCGPAATALQLSLSETAQPNPSPGPMLTVPLTGPSPECTGSSASTFVPGYVHGVGWPTHPMDSGVLPAQPSWSALVAQVTVKSLDLADVRVSVTLHNPSSTSVVLQPCPRFTIAIYNGYADGSFEPEHDALFPCGADPIIAPHESRTYALPGLDFSADTDQRTPIKRVLFFSFAELQPVRVDIPAS